MSQITRRNILLASAAAPLLRGLDAATLDQVRLSITSDEIDEDLRTAASFIHQHGLRYAELRSIWGKYNTAQPIDKIREAKALLDEYQLQTSIADTAFFRGTLLVDDRALDEQWTLLDDAMARAKILGTDKLRIFAFTFKDGETPDRKAYPRIHELLTEAGRRAKGFRLAVENLANSYVWTGAEAGELQKAVKADNIGLTWDPNNAAEKGEVPFPDGLLQSRDALEWSGGQGCIDRNVPGGFDEADPAGLANDGEARDFHRPAQPDRCARRNHRVR
jgi:sugar phosphate isomerase/epimerase